MEIKRLADTLENWKKSHLKMKEVYAKLISGGNCQTTSFFELYVILCKVNNNKIIKTTGRMKEALPMKGLTLKDSHCLVAILPVRPTHICTRVLLLQNEACMLQVHLRSRMVHNPENYLFPFITEFRQLDRNRWF